MHCGQPAIVHTQADDARLHRLTAVAPEPLIHKARAASHLAGERRVVTVLFVDVVNSTGLAERMDLETWTAVINGAFNRIIPAIYRYEGTVARTQGDAIWAFFGAPIAHEDDPARAVYAALDLLAAARDYAEELRQEHDVSFAIRACLNTGPVVIGSVGEDLRYDFQAMGGAVNMASLLKFATAPMSVLLTENSYHLVAPLFEFSDAGEIVIQGRREPLRAYHVRGPKVEPGPMRGLSTAGLKSPVVGREAELDTLIQLGETVQAGLGRAVLVVGEPGLGKTRLVIEWRKASPPATLQWVEASCASHGRGQPYHLLIMMLRALLGVTEAAGKAEPKLALCALIGEQSGETESLSETEDLEIFPCLGHLLSLDLEGPARELVQQLDPPAIQAQYLRSIRRVLRTLAARRPLVLVLDDLHWADPSSVEVLSQLLPLVSTTPLLFCLVTRPERDAPGWKLVHVLRDTLGEGLEELTLRPLSEDDSRHLVANLLDIPENARDLILDRAEGNPLFVEEVVRILIDQGSIIHRDGEWILGEALGTAEIPDKLQGLLLARIDRLPDLDSKRALRVASVIGRQFSFKVLERVLGMDPTCHLGTLEFAGLIRLAQLEPELAYSFRHTLLQEAAYASLLSSDRKRLHRAVGDALEQLYPAQIASFELAPSLGQHYLQAGDAERALYYLSLAGDASLACYANLEAESRYCEALTLAGPGAERAPLDSGLGQALYGQSRFEDAIESWRNAIALFQDQKTAGLDEVARLYGRSARAAWAGGDTPGGLRICQQGLNAVATAPDGPGFALLLHEAARAYLFNGRAEEAQPLCRQALEMAERLGVVEVQAEALTTLGLLLGQEPELALGALEKAVQLAESAGLLSQAARAHLNLAATYSNQIEDFRVAVEQYRMAADRHEARGDTSMQLLALGGMTDAMLKLGDLVPVFASLSMMRQLLNQLVEPGPTEFHLRFNEATLLRFQGALDDATGRLRSLQEDARSRNDKEILREVDRLLADTLLEFCLLEKGAGTREGLWQEVEVCLTEAMQICKDWGQSDAWVRCYMSMLARLPGTNKRC